MKPEEGGHGGDELGDGLGFGEPGLDGLREGHGELLCRWMRTMRSGAGWESRVQTLVSSSR